MKVSEAGRLRGCPERAVLEHVTSTWGVLVLVELAGAGTLRPSELRRRIGGVSEKMLAQTLRTLERDGFVRRLAHPVIPPHVDYDLTPLGHQVAGKVRALAEWTAGNMAAVAAAQRAYDAAR
ncbi:winged helix-turn-helix transcriptional regulator [Actinacidiphila reveromycinica]|nr:helix-turn-helix domain-containing protein [Streptomyces sp. SN-593]